MSEPASVSLDWHQEMPHSSSQLVPRKTLAIKHADGEPLTRADIQYDLLFHIFQDTRAVFCDPYRTLQGHPAGTKVTFRDLYVNALTRSPRCSKGLREKILETSEFGTDFAKIALLANVGRINTTMASVPYLLCLRLGRVDLSFESIPGSYVTSDQEYCPLVFPELRTSLRTYHPVPSLQKTDGNLQDAPRIKNILKSCLLPGELSGPSTPLDILTRSRSGQNPPTTIVNLVFVMANHAIPLGRAHFSASLDFLDIFLNTTLTSASRATAFLWLCYHHLEMNSENPFSDTYASQNLGKAPLLETLPEGQEESENVDPDEEVTWGSRMTAYRKVFLAKHTLSGKAEVSEGSDAKEKVADTSVIARRNRNKKALSKSISPMTGGIEGPAILMPQPREFRQDLFTKEPLPDVRHRLVPVDWHRRRAADPPNPSITPIPMKRRKTTNVPPLFVYRRTMLQHAWHTVCTTDPVLDSDEDITDEHVQVDCVRRIHVLNRLRGREPTPETDGVHRLSPSRVGPEYATPWSM